MFVEPAFVCVSSWDRETASEVRGDVVEITPSGLPAAKFIDVL